MAKARRLPDNVSLALGAVLEPLGVAIHASKRAQTAPGSSTLVLGAGAVGLLCAAMSKVMGFSNVVIADIQAERVKFAIDNGFAHGGFVVPRKRGQDIGEKLQIAKETAALAAEVKTVEGDNLGEVDIVFECTGVEACTQAAIYVGSEHYSFKSRSLIAVDDTPRRKGCDCRYGESRSDAANLRCCAA